MSKNAITTPERLEDDTLEASLRPKRLADFVGQRQELDNLSIFISAAKERGEAGCARERKTPCPGLAGKPDARKHKCGFVRKGLPPYPRIR